MSVPIAPVVSNGNANGRSLPVSRERARQAGFGDAATIALRSCNPGRMRRRLAVNLAFRAIVEDGGFLDDVDPEYRELEIREIWGRLEDVYELGPETVS